MQEYLEVYKFFVTKYVTIIIDSLKYVPTESALTIPTYLRNCEAHFLSQNGL